MFQGKEPKGGAPIMPTDTDVLSSALTQLRAACLHILSGSCASHAVAAGAVVGSAGLTGLAGSGPAPSAAGRSPRRARRWSVEQVEGQPVDEGRHQVRPRRPRVPCSPTCRPPPPRGPASTRRSCWPPTPSEAAWARSSPHRTWPSPQPRWTPPDPSRLRGRRTCTDASDVGSGTYFPPEDCVLPPTTAPRHAHSGGKRSPRRESTSSR